MSPTVRSRSNQGIGRIPHLWNADLRDVAGRQLIIHSSRRSASGGVGGLEALSEGPLPESSETPWRAQPDAENGRRATKFENFLRARLKTADPRYIRP